MNISNKTLPLFIISIDQLLDGILEINNKSINQKHLHEYNCSDNINSKHVVLYLCFMRKKHQLSSRDVTQVDVCDAH
jgi:hypothetical protein